MFYVIRIKVLTDRHRSAFTTSPRDLKSVFHLECKDVLRKKNPKVNPLSHAEEERRNVGFYFYNRKWTLKTCIVQK